MSPRCLWPEPDADHLLVSGDQMAALEQQLFDSGLPVAALMEKAALTLAARLLQRLRPAGGGASGLESDADAGPSWLRPLGVLVLAGPGHNGGDGLVVARELHLAGVPVRLWSPFERHKPLTAAHLAHARWLGIPCLDAPPDPADPALWLDALFGIGQKRPPGDRLESLLEERQRQRPGGLAAVDGPTGVCADSGRLLGAGAATAALTWSIGLIKCGLLQDRALARVGRLERLDLGLPASLLATLPQPCPRLLLPGDAVSAPWPRPDPAAAKYGRGRALVVAGSARYRGAAALALAGASASGCGSLRAVLPAELAADLWQQQPHVVVEAALPSAPDGALQLTGLDDLDLDRLDALLLGPGLGGGGLWPQAQRSEWQEAEAQRADRQQHDVQQLQLWERLRCFPGLLVCDADGLNRLAGHGREQPGGAMAWLQQRAGSTWLTPHRAEFARLFPAWADADPLQAAAAAAEASGAAVLLKGARSVVAAPDGRLWQLARAAQQSARAGLGDTLAGYAVGRGAMAMAARGEADRAAADRAAGPLDAALLAAVMLEHAEAGFRALRRWGEGGATPQAVAEALAHHPVGMANRTVADG